MGGSASRWDEKGLDGLGGPTRGRTGRAAALQHRSAQDGEADEETQKSGKMDDNRTECRAVPRCAVLCCAAIPSCSHRLRIDKVCGDEYRHRTRAPFSTESLAPAPVRPRDSGWRPEARGVGCVL